jgi:hypothetical protein
VQEQINSIERDVKEIKEVILGNKYNKNGMLKRIDTLEDYQGKDKKHKWMIAGGVTVLGLIGKFWDKLTDLI